MQSYSHTFEPWKILYQNDDIMVVQTLAKSMNDIKTAQNNKNIMGNDLLYGAFNLGLHVQDNPKKVLTNRAYLLSTLNQLNQKNTTNKTMTAIHRIHWLNQIHGDNVINIDKQPLSIKAKDADAMITGSKGVALAIMTADCVPICLHFVDFGLVACIHAGWQGLANGIIQKTINSVFHLVNRQSATDGYKSKVVAWIGACIGGQNYEVNEDLAHTLVKQSLQNIASNDILTHDIKTDKSYHELYDLITRPHTQPNKAWLNIQALAVWQLEQIGKQHQINMQLYNRQAACSYADDLYYSHRRATHLAKPHTGRMAMLIFRR